jgi:hypothetical protein
MRRLLDYLPVLVALAALALALFLSAGDREREPARPPAPPPPCPDDRCPRPPPKKPWDECVSATVGGPRHSDGTEVDCDLPERFHVKNRGGSDGSGLCVFASMRHSGLWQDEPVFSGLFEFMTARPGRFSPSRAGYAQLMPS